MSRRVCVLGVLLLGLMAMPGCGSGMAPELTGSIGWAFDGNLFAILISVGWLLSQDFRGV